MRILFVEDEPSIAEAVASLLKKHHYSVDLAFDGETGLDYATSGVYDILVLDIMLPKIDGITLLKTLRKQNIRTPIIMLTAKSEVDDKVLGLDAGAVTSLLILVPGSVVNGCVLTTPRIQALRKWA